MGDGELCRRHSMKIWGNVRKKKIPPERDPDNVLVAGTIEFVKRVDVGTCFYFIHRFYNAVF